MAKITQLISTLRLNFFTLFVAILVILIPLPLTIIVIIPSLLYRNLVKLIAWLFRSDLSAIFRGKGAFFALESVYTRPKLSILLHFVFDGSLPLDKLRHQFQQKLINATDSHGNLIYPQLRQSWTQFLGFIFWKWDANFDLNNHVRLYEKNDTKILLPSPFTETDLKSVTAELLARPFASGRSPWEIIVMPNYISNSDKFDGKERTVIMFRIHHAMADGFSILKMMFKLFDLDGAKVPKATFPKLTISQKILRALVLPLTLPWDIAELLVSSFDGPNSWHLTNQKLSRDYVTFFSDQIKVEDVKQVKNLHRVGYNSAVYAIAAGGMRRFMIEGGQKVPHKMSCFVPFPLPRHPGGLCVHVSGFFFQFSPRICSPGRRLEEIAKNMQVLNKAPTVPIIFGWSVDLFGLMPAWIMRLVYNKMMMTLAMTSFPGPENELDIMDSAKLVDIIPALGHMPGKLGVTAVLVSMAGKQRIVLTMDKDIFKNAKTFPQNFAKHINDELEALLYQDSPSGPDVALV